MKRKMDRIMSSSKPPETSPEAEPKREDPVNTGARSPAKSQPPPLPREHGGRKGPEPTRYGDWEVRGIVSDF